MPHMPFLDHIDPGQGGSAMVIPELPAWTSFNLPERYSCKQCGAVFGAYEEWFAHRFDKHPLRRPILVLGDHEVLTPRYTAQASVSSEAIRTVNTVACRINGRIVSPNELSEVLLAKPRGFFSITLFGEEGVRSEYEISVEIPKLEDLALVERDFALLANHGRLTVHTINAFVEQAASATTAKRLTDGLANFMLGILAKDQRGDTTLTQEQGRAKLNEAHQTLSEIKRPLAQAIAGVVEFGANAFQRQQWLRPVPQLQQAIGWYRSASEGNVAELALEQEAFSTSKWRVPLDSATHELITWVCMPARARLEEGRAIARRGSQLSWLHEDRIKASVLLASTFHALGEAGQAAEMARSFRHDPVFGGLAERLLR